MVNKDETCFGEIFVIYECLNALQWMKVAEHCFNDTPMHV